MPDDPDLELLARWREGDRRAGQQLVARYFDQIRGFFINSVSDEEREDLVQDTFRRLVGAKDRFEGRSSFRTFLFRIAHNTLIDFYRKRGRGKFDFDPMLHSVADLDGVSPSHLVTAVERHQQLLACVRALPLETKQLLELYYWHDFTAAQIAETMGINERTLRSRLVAARKRLIKALAEQAEGGGQAGGEEPELDSALRELGQFFSSGQT